MELLINISTLASYKSNYPMKSEVMDRLKQALIEQGFIDEEDINIPIEYIEAFQSSKEEIEEINTYRFKGYDHKHNDLNWGTTIILALFVYISDRIKNTTDELILNGFYIITILLILYLLSFIIYKIASRISTERYIEYVGIYRLKLLYLKNLYRYRKIKDDENLEFWANEINTANEGVNKDNYLFGKEVVVDIENKRKRLRNSQILLNVTYYLCLSVLIVFIFLIPAYFLYKNYCL